jgi:ribosomal protein S24E
MEMKVTSKADQPLMKRSAVEGVISFESATSSRVDVRKKLAESLKADEQAIGVASIMTSYGGRSAVFKAHVYASKDAYEQLEAPATKARHLPKEKKPAGEA